MAGGASPAPPVATAAAAAAEAKPPLGCGMRLPAAEAGSPDRVCGRAGSCCPPLLLVSSDMSSPPPNAAATAAAAEGLCAAPAPAACVKDPVSGSGADAKANDATARPDVPRRALLLLKASAWRGVQGSDEPTPTPTPIPPPSSDGLAAASPPTVAVPRTAEKEPTREPLVLREPCGAEGSRWKDMRLPSVSAGPDSADATAAYSPRLLERTGMARTPVDGAEPGAWGEPCCGAGGWWAAGGRG